MKFIYNSGDRPLDGYTLKRGIGRGGFGEVYYAISDGGKEVALKLVRGGNLEVELRGMAQCLNLKHPHLVSLYDMRKDTQGDHWVIMEYIAGEPLSAVLSRHPEGLPQELAQQWFLALSRAVGYLHDHGIVHRDLKPANIFVENGLVKVGDYGLCKFISGSHRTAQTQSVGTVHYMAPEISTGNYNKQIDIYAAGIILYEMLTGRVPFEGESAGEILMKHLTTPPDLTKLSGQYVPIVGKALAKNPAHRFTCMAEMAKTVESVSLDPCAEPNVPREAPVAQRAAQAAEARTMNPPRPAAAAARPAPAARLDAIPTALPVHSVRHLAAELCGSLAMSAILTGLATVLVFGLARGEISTHDLGQQLFLTIAACWAVLVPAKFWTVNRGDFWGRRIVMMVLGLGVGLSAMWLDGWNPDFQLSPEMHRTNVAGWVPTSMGSNAGSVGMSTAGALTYFALAFFALRWWKLTDRRRAHRFSFAPILAAGFWGLVLLIIWDEPLRGTLVLTMSAAIVQLVSPWEPSPPPLARRMRLRYA